MWLQVDTMISCVCLLLFLPRTQRGFDVFCCCCNYVLTRIMKKALQIHTVESLKTFECERAMEASPHSMKGHAVLHSTTCTPSSTALKGMAADIGHFEIEDRRLNCNLTLDMAQTSETSKGGITPMSSITAMEMLEE